MLSLVRTKAFQSNNWPHSEGPIFLELHPTNKCNSNCLFCNQTMHQRKGELIEFNQLLDIIKELVEKGRKVVRISGGGEPTTYPYLFELLEFLRVNNITVSIFSTNGILFKKGLAQKLKDVSIQIIHFSLQAPTPMSWSKITGLPPRLFKDILTQIKLIRGLTCIPIVISFVVHELTYNEIKKAALLCQKLSAWCSIHDLNNYSYTPSFLDDIDKVKEMLIRLRIKYDKVSYGFYNIESLKVLSDCSEKWLLRAKTRVIPDREICLAPWYSALIRANGDMYVCCALDNEEHCLGNIFKTSFSNIWNGSKAKEMKKNAAELFLSDNMPRFTGTYKYLAKQ